MAFNGLLMASNVKYTKARRTRKYSSVWFHGFRFVQFLASTMVAGVMFLFIHHLQDTNITIPWMFFLVSLPILRSNSASDIYKLQAAALTTFSWIILSSLLHYYYRLSPFCNIIVNGFMVCIWTVAFTLLVRRMDGYSHWPEMYDRSLGSWQRRPCLQERIL
ncbi:hypothetical protein C7974DRAFT_405434 [Boeremia exigua]|uniref:uncharacterized protein n=1 Tax=Boeremia exigua TaxID=749465 RepID=UPI001E8CDFCB|nr:uncharacterized protein C7974DRAFT_405434 [Boeremia exigua]KAH6612364.1 hypothetical protein C7974DRAFT_405434 [Boeremia exigua]